MDIIKTIIGGAVLVGGIIILKRVAEELELEKKFKEKKSDKEDTKPQRQKDHEYAATQRRAYHKKVNAMGLDKKEKDALKKIWEDMHIVKTNDKVYVNKEALKTALAEAYVRAQQRRTMKRSKIHVNNTSTQH